MKPCERIVDLFYELQETRLDEEQDRSAREHLRHCPVCREEFKWYGLTVQALANLERVTPPAHFTAQLRAKLYATETSPSFFDSFRQIFTSFPYLPLPVGVTALAFVAAVAFVTYENTPVNLIRPAVPSTAERGARSVVSQAAAATVPKSSPVAGGTMSKGTTVVEMPAALAPTPPATADSKPASPQQEVRIARSPENALPTPLVKSQDPLALMSPKRVAKSPYNAGIPASYGRVGTDTLTVESPRIDQAVESVLRMLPDLHGRVVEQRTTGGILGERVLSVVIPPDSFGSLATELISHGVVDAGPPSDRDVASATETNGRNLVLTIRFVHRP